MMLDTTIDTTGDWAGLRLDEVVAWRARHTGDDPAVERVRDGVDVESRSWAELERGVAANAARLAAEGIAPGSRCAVVLEDTIECLELIHAVFRAGMVLVPVDAMWGRPLTENILHQSGSRVVLTPGPDGRFGLERRTTDEELARPLAAGVAMISYTSGSTADPKGVILEHRQLRAVYSAACRRLRLHHGGDPARFGCAMRLSGLGVLGIHYLLAAEFGAAIVMLPPLGIDNADTFWATVERHRIDMMYLVPALVDLLRIRSSSEATDSRTTIMCGGAPLRADAQDDFQQRFPAVLLNVYGATEVACAVYFGDREPGRAASNSLGTPVLGDARIRLGDGAILDGPGLGLLELAGPSMASGYWGNPVATAEAFVDGWYRTGDIVLRDDDGRYFHRGRAKDVVLRGGFTIYCSEVEEALLGLDGVADACAIRLREGTVSEDVGAIVVAQSGRTLDAAELAAGAADYLGSQRAPRRVIISERPVPRVANGKIDRRAAQLLWTELTADPGSHQT